QHGLAHQQVDLAAEQQIERILACNLLECELDTPIVGDGLRNIRLKAFDLAGNGQAGEAADVIRDADDYVRRIGLDPCQSGLGKRWQRCDSCWCWKRRWWNQCNQRDRCARSLGSNSREC